MSGPSAYGQLKSLMKKRTHEEDECKKLLVNALEMLVHHEPPEEFNRFEPEYAGVHGYTDVVVSCTRSSDTGEPRKHAYIWEAKSPQCYLFEADTRHRVRPTKELVSAENQLLHYYYSNRGAASFRRHFSIISDIDIHFGGIIIGQQSTLVRNSRKIRYSEDERYPLYADARDYRNMALWENSGIKLLTWDRVLNVLRPPSELPPRGAVGQAVDLSQQQI